MIKGAAMSYEEVWSETVIRKVFSGTVTGEEFMQINSKMYGDGRFSDMKGAVVDFSMAESIEFTEADVKSIAYMDNAAAQSNPKFRVAIVDPQGVVKELAEAYAGYTEASPWEVQVFDSVGEAEKWLGL